MGALSPFITTIKKIVELLKMKMKFFQLLWTVLLWTVLLWTIVVDSFPVEQDNRDGRAGPASDLGDWRWQDSGYKEYLANRTEPPFRSPDCCVVEEIEWGPTWEEVMEGNYTDQTSGWEPPTVKPPRRDTADTEETGPVDPKTLTSVLLKWMNIRYPPRTDRIYSEFTWKNESAAQPAVTTTNFFTVIEVLVSTVPMRSEEKRVWEYWAEWILEIEEEKGWSTQYNYIDQKLIGEVESIKTRLHKLQNPEAAPETPVVEPPIDDSVEKPKPANPPTGGCGGFC